MKEEYAVTDGSSILYRTAGFRDELVTETVPLSGGKELRICGQDRKELMHQLQEAEASVAAKDAFLNNMSHDIRTPMNAIVGLTLLAKMHLDETARVSDALDKIETASNHLLSLINNVLDMSRINSGRMKITPEFFALNDLIHDIMTILRPQAEKKNQNMKLATGDIPAETLFGDVLRLRQIFVNIINNAIKYTNEGGSVLVNFSEEVQGEICKLIFVCEDNGVGMSPEFLERIFDPFERVENTTVSQIEGTGLGMSIVKKLLETMGGTIDVRSRVGQGTAITVSIPLEYRQEELRSEKLRGKRLIILEGSEAIRQTYLRYLGELEVMPVFTDSAGETLDALADADISGELFNALIIGNDCGTEDKLDIAAYLHKSKPDLPIILISDDSWEEIGYRAEHSGIVSFIPLPLFRSSLVNGLAGALEENADPESASAFPDLNGKRILLVEDNPINQEIAREILSMTGAEIDLAENGREAADVFIASENGWYSLILMDVQMPVMDGYKATEAIRALSRPDAQTIPIYAMTANTFAEDIAKAYEAGMNGHIAKPIDINALIQVLRGVSG